MALFPTDIATEVRDRTNMQGSSFPTDTELFTFISRGQGKVVDDLNFVAPQINIERFSFKRSSTVSLYDLPVDFGGYLSRVEDISKSPPREIDIVTYREVDQNQGGEPKEAAIHHNQLLIGPEPQTNDSSDKIRLEYARSPENVIAGTFDSTSSTFVQLPSDPSVGVLHNYDSAYVNHEFVMTGGNAHGARKKISEYTASNRVVKFDSDFSNVPSTTDSFEFILDVPEIRAAREAVVSYASKELMRKDQMPDNVDVRDFNQAMKDLRRVVVSEGFYNTPHHNWS